MPTSLVPQKKRAELVSIGIEMIRVLTWFPTPRLSLVGLYCQSRVSIATRAYIRIMHTINKQKENQNPSTTTHTQQINGLSTHNAICNTPFGEGHRIDGYCCWEIVSWRKIPPKRFSFVRKQRRRWKIFVFDFEVHESTKQFNPAMGRWIPSVCNASSWI